LRSSPIAHTSLTSRSTSVKALCQTHASPFTLTRGSSISSLQASLLRATPISSQSFACSSTVRRGATLKSSLLKDTITGTTSYPSRTTPTTCLVGSSSLSAGSRSRSSTKHSALLPRQGGIFANHTQGTQVHPLDWRDYVTHRIHCRMHRHPYGCFWLGFGTTTSHCDGTLTIDAFS